MVGQAQQPLATASKANAKVYTFVEHMPELPGGGGMPAISAYFMRHFQPTAAEARTATGGSVVLAFVVAATGYVTKARVIRSGGTSIDAVALRTIKALPRFRPGR